MAEHGATMEVATATGNDYKEHEKTYSLFIGMTKWGSAAVVIVLILMALFLL
jgi:hypothetical protein